MDQELNAVPERWRTQIDELLRGLFDLQFQQIITTRMVPAIYALGLVLAGVFALYSVVGGFAQSLAMGLLWLFLVGPALFLAISISLRIALEVILSLFRMAVTVEEIYGIAQHISGQAEEIATDLPRIQFWRSRRKADDSDESEA